MENAKGAQLPQAGPDRAALAALIRPRKRGPAFLAGEEPQAQPPELEAELLPLLHLDLAESRKVSSMQAALFH